MKKLELKNDNVIHLIVTEIKVLNLTYFINGGSLKNLHP